jgi:glycine cleavage system H lipoate-binding protein/ABC-type phosphate transport system substrate-binding protein
MTKMKTKLILLFAVLPMIFVCGNTFQDDELERHAQNTTLVVSSSDLFPIVDHWATAYNATNQGPAIQVVQPMAEGQKPGISEVAFGIFSKQELSTVAPPNAWKLVVGRDVVVPVINANHPYMDEIYRRGISASSMKELIANEKSRTWEVLFGKGYDVPIHVFYRDDEPIVSALAEYLDVAHLHILGTKAESNDALIQQLQNDPYAIGFCRLSDIDDTGGTSLLANIRLLPLDGNGNGNLDYMENIYDDIAAFKRGVWIGKYPKAMYQNIYAVASSAPAKAEEIAFLKWIITSGQESLLALGYEGLVPSELPAKLSRLNGLAVKPIRTDPGWPGFTRTLMTLVAVVALLFVLDYFIRKYRRSQVNLKTEKVFLPIKVDDESTRAPSGVYFDKSYTWAFLEKAGTMQVGITDFLLHMTGAFSRVEMKQEGEAVIKGEPIMTLVQNGKQLVINAPISGTIKTSNKKLIRDAGILVDSPYESGWVYVIEPTNWFREKDFLKDAKKYKEWLGTEIVRFKDFIARSISIHPLEPAPVVLQDGGEIAEQALSHLGPEIWDDFQTQFLDKAQ